MPEEETESLWLFGEREPWRRGREAIVIISIIILLGHAAVAIYCLLNGQLPRFFGVSIVGCIATFSLFLVWIGQNWARWLLAPFFAAAGLCFIVWGIVFGGMGVLFLIGVGALIIFCYLALSPNVYAFARRQRAQISLLESVIAGVVLLVTLGGVGIGLFALALYKNSVERDALSFSELAFHRTFVNRDPLFLEEHSTMGRKYSRAQEFINMNDRLGEVRSVGPFAGTFRYQFVNRVLHLKGMVRTRALFEADGAWVTIQLSGHAGHWEIEHMFWEY